MDGIGVRDVLFEAYQCYFAVGQAQSVRDGSVHIFTISSAGGHIEGTVSPGVNGRPLVWAGRRDGDPHFDFIQADAAIDYEGDDDEDKSSTTGARLLFGEADVGPTGHVAFRKGVEVYAGTAGTTLQSQTVALGGALEQISYGGTLIYRGEGMDAACNMTGRYSVSTSDAIALDFSGDDAYASGGSLAITAGAANATVEFLASGAAVVTTANGSATTYPLPDVEAHCGFDQP